ncbi:DNA-binding protein P3A2-like isoform X3 [Anopheles albimanus]|uniref:DNA-binding protein P3A2-like isoform X3 n=1 Tax=Anopheles albimanus TaxID=7167 RepID=UPI001641369F|nr:DNA-binding protein P3A2-like isoform X3 [Anopheles albimanus]
MSLTIHSVDAMELIEDDNITGASDDDDDDNPSSPGSAYDDGNLINVAMENEVTAQLVAAGVVGVAAAAAITSSKKKKRPHSFETNPSIRKRQQNRLLRKLRQTIFEYATRVGQQAVVLVATPGKPNNIYKVFGAKPLEDVLKNLRNNVMDKLDEALAAQAPPRVQDDPSLFELPPLIIDGIPTPVEKMTQAQLRAFIPLMLKYSTGRGKPGWGRDSTRPPWWPKELPWANVRMDARSEDEKQKISWTHALRKIVINCYKYHGREDLLPAFSEEDEKANAIATASSNFTHTVLQTIQNADGTVSIIQVDPNNPIITLPDGTTAQVQGIATLQQQGDGGVHTIQTISDGQGESMSVDLTEATLGQDGQLIITGEDGQGFPVNVSGMITVPMSAQMYQTMVANIQQVPNVDGTVCITPMQVSNLASNANQQTTPTSTHNLTIATNGAHQSTHHQQQQQQAIAMMANYSLGSNVGPGAVLNLPQLTAHHLSQAVGQNKHHHAQRNNSIRAGNTSSPVVGFNTAQRVCLNVSTPSANNQHASANLSTGVLSLNRKSNLGDGSEGSIEVCIPKIEPMDEDKDGTTDGSAGVTQNFVIQLNGQSFTVNDGKSLQHQHLKRSIEHSVNDGSHLIDALTISAKHVAGSSASEIDTKHFAIPSV